MKSDKELSDELAVVLARKEELEHEIARRAKEKKNDDRAAKRALPKPPRPRRMVYGVKGMVYPETHHMAGKPVEYAGGTMPKPFKDWLQTPEAIAWRDDPTNTTMLPVITGITLKGDDTAWTPAKRKAHWDKIAHYIGRSR